MINICNIITNNETDQKYLIEYLGNYPVTFCNSFKDELLAQPTIIIGWSNVKQLFPNQNILNKEIKNNLTWTFSKNEEVDDIQIQNDISNFFRSSVLNWLPSNFILYDYSLSNMDIQEFFDKNIDKEDKISIFFYEGAMYMCQNDKNYIINIKDLLFFDESYKKIITNILNTYNVLVFSYKNIEDYVCFDELNNIKSLEILRWVKYKTETKDNYFSIFPGFNSNKYSAFIMNLLPDIVLNTEDESLDYIRSCFREKITRWMSSMYISFSDDFKNSKMNFLYRRGCKLAKVNYSNKKTITGRIVTNDVYSPQNLQRDSDDRKYIKSQFENGKIFVFDYESFEARIALYVSKDVEFIKKNYNKDMHLETAKIIFNKDLIQEEERNIAKIVNHSILYGASQKTIFERLSFSNNPESLYYKVVEYLGPILLSIDRINKFYKEKSYIVNAWDSIVIPEKDHAVFNNYIQSSATEIIIDKTYEIKQLLKDKKSKFLFQVHDSMIFDIHPEEMYLEQEIKNTLSIVKKMFFPISIKKGENFKEIY